MMQVKKMFNPKDTVPPSPCRGHDEDEEMGMSRDESLTSKDKINYHSPREPEDPSARSPGDDTRETSSKDILKVEKLSFVQPMDTDSPPAYPKHVIVPSSDSPSRPVKIARKSVSSRPTFSSVRGWNPENIVTPILSHEAVGPLSSRSTYGSLAYRPGGPPAFPEMYGGPYRQARSSYGTTEGVHQRPKRWACDFCCVATFLTYEAACSHEKTCRRRYSNFQGDSPNTPYGGGMSQYSASQLAPMRQMSPALNNKQLGGLGALYQAVQEVQQGTRKEGTLPRAGGYPPIPSDPNAHPTLSPRLRIPTGPDHARMVMLPTRRHQHPPQRRMLLAMPSDVESLSDRQCYVRSEFVEVFEATNKEVSARHSKGAQKLAMGQVGIRCMYCAHLHPKNRAERAVCYPSSISRIYQTVADMQRFHFEHCREIPDETREIYKSLKTTRPRGVGSPQTYWVHSAKLLNLIDSDNGIRFSQGDAMTDKAGS